MRKLLSIILLLANLQSFATTYYVDFTGGLDANNGLSSGAAWKTIAKVNSFTFLSGDIVLLKRGETWHEPLVVNRNNISFDYYGTGANPKLTGFIALSGWSNISSGVWSVSAPAVKSTVNMAAINGIPQEIGRYPNSDAANGGYITVTGFTSNTNYQASQFSATNWTGAEVVSRLRGYLVERYSVTAQTADVITYVRTILSINPRSQGFSPATAPTQTGFGVFFQRDIRTLDKFGEWYFNPTTKMFSMYFGANNPASYTVQVSTLDTLINVGSHTNVSINHIDMEGSNLAGVFAADGSSLSVTNCSIINNGAKAIFVWNEPNTSTSGLTIRNSMCSGIDARVNGTMANVVHRNDSVINTAMYIGMSAFFDPADATGIWMMATSGGVCSRNRIDTIGYIPIRYDGTNINIDSNHITDFAFNRNDGGAIYGFQTPAANVNIRKNFAITGHNATAGTFENNAPHGLYCDGGIGHVYMDGNTMANIPGLGYSAGFGIFMNSPKGNTITNNIIYNTNGWYIGRQYGDSSSACIIKNNIFFNTSTAQDASVITHTGLNSALQYTATTMNNFMSQIGTVDSNYYNSPTVAPFWWYYKILNTDLNFVNNGNTTFANWKTASSLDVHSTINNITGYQLLLNPTLTTQTTTFTGSVYKDLAGTSYSNSITIPAWSSKIIYYFGSSTATPPIANAGVDKSITLPVNYVTITGSATGSAPITYSWLKVSGPSGDAILHNRTDTTTITFTAAGTYQYALLATDATTLTGSDTMQVVVNPNPIVITPPTVNAGTDQTIQLPVDSVYLTMTFTGNLSNVGWRVLYGPSSTYVLSDPTSLNTSFKNLAAGAYAVEASVRDFNGLTARDTLAITVLAAAPVTGPSCGLISNVSKTLPFVSTVLTGVATAHTYPISTYLWSQTGGTATTISGGATTTATITAITLNGKYVYQFRATDDHGNFCTSSVTITALDASCNCIITKNGRGRIKQ